MRFADGSEEPLDAIIYATGYKISFPFLPSEVYQMRANEMNPYLNVVPPEQPRLFFYWLYSAVGGDYAVGGVTGAVGGEAAAERVGFAG